MHRLRIARINHADDGDQGAIAVLVAVLVVVLFGITAFALDISTQLSKKQTLQNTLDSAALAAATQLDGTSLGLDKARRAIASTFDYNDASLNDPSGPQWRTTFYCVVPASATADVADFTAIPTVCQPGAAPWTSSSYPASSYTCNSTTCYIPCSAASVTALTCIPNAVGVGAAKPVSFTFGPAIGIGQGSTGTVVSVACSSRCGSPVTNPADIVVIADRSGSMSSYMNDETTAISEALKFVGNSATQHVALGTVGYTDTSSNACSEPDTSMVKPMTTSPSLGTEQPEAWVPIGFSQDFTGATLGTLNPSSSVVKALNCLRTAKANSRTGSWMATPLKVASNYLLGQATLGSGNGQLPRSNVSKAIIFETDQQPNESPAKATTTVTTPQIEKVSRKSLTNNVATITTAATHQINVGDSVVVSGVDAVFNGTWTVTAVKRTTFSYDVVARDVKGVQSSGTVAYSTTTTTTATPPGSVVCDYTTNQGCGPDPLVDNANIGNSDEVQACRNFKYVADRAKALGIVIAMISYNPGSSANCQSLLGLSHDPIASQVGGAYLSYSAANSTQLAAQFKAAVSAVTANARLVRLP
jgi:Flp pilus assembly protein TadG